MIGMLPGIELTAKTALIPILNLSLVCKEMLSGVWHWHYIALIFGSTCVYAAAALALVRADVQPRGRDVPGVSPRRRVGT
jgi:sodium transport system permease protein